MNFLMHNALRCPLDHLPLAAVGSSLRCAAGHSFDIARQGYVNLLSAQDKRSSDPGDSKAMIQARRCFLDAGHYQPISTSVNQLVAESCGQQSLIVDAGCGEGYYTQQLTDSLQRANLDHTLLGFDISKWAVQAAAKRHPATWLVASNRAIPVADQSANLVLSLFGFPAYAEFERILRPGGKLILANAGAQHLIELRKIIYPRIKPARPRDMAAPAAAGLSLCRQENLSYALPGLDRETLSRLLAMTPHLFRASAEGKQRVAALNELSLTVDISFDIFSAP